MKIAIQIILLIVVLAMLLWALSYAVGVVFYLLIGAFVLAIIGVVISSLLHRRKESPAAILSAHRRAEKSAEKALKDMERKIKT